MLGFSLKQTPNVNPSVTIGSRNIVMRQRRPLSRPCFRCVKCALVLHQKCMDWSVSFVHQMRTVPGGISMLIEHWVEQYHQTAAAMERIWASHPYTKQAEFCVRREHMLSHKETTEAEARIVK
jgi:hypothetical protein